MKIIWPCPIKGFPHSSAGKESSCKARDPSLIPVSGRSTGEEISYPLQYFWAFLVPPGKESTWSVGDLGLVPGWGRPAGPEKGYQLQCFGLDNPMDYTVHGVTKSWTHLSDLHFLSLTFFYLNENWTFPVFRHCWVFQIYWHIECSTLTASSLGFEIAQLECHHFY